MKKTVTEKDRHHCIEFTDSIDNVISMLQKYKKEGWTDIDCDYCYDTISYHFCKQRLETDSEYNERILQEETRKENRRKDYEAMKKEFGDE